MKKVVIIGGGIAGLAAGIYAQKAGLESIIYEKHTIPGGECTGWDRQGFHIDGSIHWLMGTREDTELNKIWSETGALENTDIYQLDSFATVDFQGIRVELARDIEQMKNHLLEISPEDEAEINRLSSFIDVFYGFEPPCDKPLDLMTFFEKIRFYSSMSKIGKVTRVIGKLSVDEYIRKFKCAAIREALRAVVPDYYSAYLLPFTLAAFISGNGGRPKGGSRALAQRMAAKYEACGGKLILGETVKKINVNNGTADSIILDDGVKVAADYIIPACDAHVTFQKLLGGHYIDDEFAKRYKDSTTYPLQTCVYVALGIDTDLSAYPENLIIECSKFAFENKDEAALSIKHYCYEPSFAPAGKSVAIIYFHAEYDWWQKLKTNHNEYESEKIRLANDVVIRLEDHFPELSGKINILDVATPLTYERYCGAYKGSYMSFGTTPDSKSLMHNGKIKGINNVYMAGQWLMPPGGLPAAVLTGKWAIQRIIKSS